MPRLQGASVYDLKGYVPWLSDAKLLSSLKLLVKDRANIVCEAGIDKKTQTQLYAINWVAGFKSVKATLVEKIVATTYGEHHSRVVRVLRQTGMPVQEKDLIRMCLLPQQNIASIVNRLLSDGLINIPKLEKGRHNDLLIFKLEMPHVC